MGKCSSDDVRVNEEADMAFEKPEIRRVITPVRAPERSPSVPVPAEPSTPSTTPAPSEPRTT